MRKKDVSPFSNSRLIAYTLLHLLQEKQLQDISFSEIASNANLSKDTCYRHFKSNEEILWFYLRCEIEDNLKRFSMIEVKNETKFRRSFFQMFQNKKCETSLIHSNGMERLLYKAVDYYFREENLFIRTPEHQYRRAYMIGGIYGVLIAWIERGMSDNAMDMAILSLKLEHDCEKGDVSMYAGEKRIFYKLRDSNENEEIYRTED